MTDIPSDFPLEALILDFDGTIADTIPLCIEAYQETLEHHTGRRPTAAEVIGGFGPAEEGMLQQEFGDELWHEAHETFLAHYERLHAGVPAPFAGAVELFEELTEVGLRLGIVTGKGPGSLDVSLRVLELDRWFPGDTRRAGSPKGAVKVECITDLLSTWQIAPGASAYLGDMPSDVHAARRVGTLALAATWASNVDHAALAAAGPDVSFDSFAELGEWLAPRLRSR